MARLIYPDNIPEEKTWDVVGSEYLIKRPWMTARRDHLVMPSGNHCPEWYVMEFPEWINVIAITKDGEFVMERQYRPGLKRYDWEIPAGVVETTDKTPLAGAQRELLEETGFGGGEWRELMCVSGNAAAYNNITYCYLAKGVRQIAEQSLDAGEDLAWSLHDEKDVKMMLQEGEFVQSLMAAPLWKYFATPNGSECL